MMKCFYYFKDKSKRGKSQSNSAPPSVPISNNGHGTGRSDVSASARQASTSSGSASMSSQRTISALYEERAGNLRDFELAELRIATNDFSRLFKIGEGGFGSVYKGIIRPSRGKAEKIQVAIKKLNQNGLQGHKQWLAEVQFLSVVEHPNLVKLIGYCAVDGERGIERLLVYEYMPNKSLEEHLFNRAYPPLHWDTRLDIILGAAEGLRYLHEGLETPIIYRDLKASNVLLDRELKPKLSDFGLAREGPAADRTHVTTAVVGTHGYAAPEYIKTGHLTMNSDVWTFGVVLYEILTGRRSLEQNRPRGEQKLLDWVNRFPVESKRFYMIMDHRLGNEYSLSAARLVAQLANRCLSKNPKDRPTMPEVIESLKHAIQVTKTSDGLTEDACLTDSDGERQPEEADVGVAESFKRRMVHLARLGDTTKVETRRRFMAMQRPNQTQQA